MIDRVPPNNIEAEQSVLGAMFLQREAIAEAAEQLHVTDFYTEKHQRLFETMVGLYNSGVPCDIVTVANELQKNGLLEVAGGASYVASVANSVPTAANIKFHCEIVKEKGTLRRLINVGTSVAGLGYSPDGDLVDVLDKAERLVYEVAHNRETRESVFVGSLLGQAFDTIDSLVLTKGKVTGLPTGYADLDRLTSGLQKSDFIIIAARPSMGKTAFALNIASNVAIKENKPVAVFSLEMPKEQLTQRLLCSEAAIDLSNLRIGAIDEKDRKKLNVAGERLDAAPLIINDTAGLKISDLRSQARKLKAKHDIQLLIIDYLQLMYSDKAKYNENRQQEVSDISRVLKSLARELAIPVIALSQLSRKVEERQSKRPQLSDLRESGSLEQDADIVAFLYRDDYYDKESEDKNLAELAIAKHRNGPTDTIKLYYHQAYTRFDSYLSSSKGVL